MDCNEVNNILKQASEGIVLDIRKEGAVINHFRECSVCRQKAKELFQKNSEAHFALKRLQPV